MQNRYVAVIEFYVWADSDEKAIEQVQKLCDEQDQKEDNRCSILKIVEQPFGTLGNRHVYGEK